MTSLLTNTTTNKKRPLLLTISSVLFALEGVLLAFIGFLLIISIIMIAMTLSNKGNEYEFAKALLWDNLSNFTLVFGVIAVLTLFYGLVLIFAAKKLWELKKSGGYAGLALSVVGLGYYVLSFFTGGISVLTDILFSTGLVITIIQFFGIAVSWKCLE